MRLSHPTYAAVLVALSTVLAIPQAAAEMRVIESTSPHYRVGATLPDSATPRLNAGEYVKVLLIPSNRTKVFAGAGKAAKPGVPGGTRGIKKDE